MQPRNSDSHVGGYPYRHLDGEKLKKNGQMELGSGLFDASVLTTIFSLFLAKAGEIFLQESGKYFLFPFAALANIMRASFAWRQAHLDGYKRGSWVKAVMETLFTIAITFAVVASLIAADMFGKFISPLIFTVTLACKTVYQIAAAAFYWGKSWVELPGSQKHAEYVDKAIINGIAALSTAFAVAAIATVFMFAQSFLAPLGVVAGGIGVLLTVWALVKSPPVGEVQFDTGQTNDEDGPQLDSTAGIHNNLRHAGHVHTHRRSHQPYHMQSYTTLPATNGSGQGAYSTAFDDHPHSHADVSLSSASSSAFPSPSAALAAAGVPPPPALLSTYNSNDKRGAPSSLYSTLSSSSRTQPQPPHYQVPPLSLNDGSDEGEEETEDAELLNGSRSGSSLRQRAG
jgi:hypothetical protein